jgi:hypothetical protein
MLEGKYADIVVAPRTLDELRCVVSAASHLRIPITERGGGSANYGQSVPLRGGIVLDMTGYEESLSSHLAECGRKQGRLLATPRCHELQPQLANTWPIQESEESR